MYRRYGPGSHPVDHKPYSADNIHYDTSVIRGHLQKTAALILLNHLETLHSRHEIYGFTLPLAVALR